MTDERTVTSLAPGALRGQRVLVTGASSGIGAATVHLLAGAGAAVAVHYHRHAAAAAALVDRIRAAGGTAEAFQADLTDRRARAALVPAVIEQLGGLDGLVNNAGTPQGLKPFLELTEVEWDRTLALNAEAPCFLAQAAFRHMQTHGGGRIVNVSSIGVKYGGSNQTCHYAAAKAALEAITVGLAKLGAAHHILVNTVRPGVISTPFYADTPAADFEARVRLIPLGRPGTPEEVAAMIGYLLSPAAAFITGQTFAVSGGE